MQCPPFRAGEGQREQETIAESPVIISKFHSVTNACALFAISSQTSITFFERNFIIF